MEARDLPPWSERIDKLFFRGALTGNRIYVAEDQRFMENPSVDANFSRWSGDSNFTHVSLPDHCNYK